MQGHVTLARSTVRTQLVGRDRRTRCHAPGWASLVGGAAPGSLTEREHAVGPARPAVERADLINGCRGGARGVPVLGGIRS
jgi:hypothetical protein